MLPDNCEYVFENIKYKLHYTATFMREYHSHDFQFNADFDQCRIKVFLGPRAYILRRPF
jgi:hypothetical protein